MKQHWHINPLPPPDESTDGNDGFVSFALLLFVIIGPLIYFGPELRTIETWIVDGYWTVETWLLQIRNWFLTLIE